MITIAENIRSIISKLPKGSALVAVSKTKPAKLLMEAYDAGHRAFGENKVQELLEKHETLPKDIEWHLIGHLQSNKVKYIASFVKLIHSVDSTKLLTTIDTEAKRYNRVIDCLLQLKIAREDTKFGMSLPEAEKMLQSAEFHSSSNIRIVGVMGMATFTNDCEQIRKEFRMLKQFFDLLKEKYFANSLSFSELSMGMSDDYLIALEEGSTLIRVGSKIFGDRVYS
jgi:PLP dependent protein